MKLVQRFHHVEARVEHRAEIAPGRQHSSAMAAASAIMRAGLVRFRLTSRVHDSDAARHKPLGAES